MTHSGRRAVAVGLATLAVSGALVANQAGTPRILAGIVRQDGAVVPFAEYRAGQWSVPDGELVERKAPWFTAGGPVPATWHYQPVTGSIETMTTTTARELASHCQTYWGLSSSLAGRPVPKNTAHLNLGVALSNVRDLERPITLLTIDAEASRMRAFLLERFDRLETAAIDEHSPMRTVVPDQRATIPIEFEKIFRTRKPIDGRHIFYLEVGRTYHRLAPQNDPGCPPTSLLRAWLSENPDGAMTLLDSSMIVTDCDRKGGYTLTPFGIATIDGRAYALTEERGYEDERYGVFEIAPRAITRRVTIGAGGC